MKRIVIFAVSFLLFSTSASAESIWNSINLTISGSNTPKVVAELDKLMASMGDKLTGSVSIMAYIANGDGTATHNIITSLDSRPSM